MNNYTVIIPTRNNLDYANKAVKDVLDNSECRVILIDDHTGPILNYYRNERVNVIYNTQKQSLSQLWNQGILASKTDNVIIMSHRSRPRKNAFLKLDELLKKNYSFAGINGFHFFGFNKYLLSIVGLFDDSFKTANFEDNDFVYRNFEHNLGYFLSGTNDVWDEGVSSWINVDTLSNKEYFNRKWKVDYDNKILEKIFIEKNIDSKNLFSKFNKINYLEFKDSVDSYKDKCYSFLNYVKIKT